MNRVLDYVKKHPIIVIALIGGLLLLYLLMKSLKRGGSSGSVQPAVVYPAGTSGSLPGAVGSPGNVSTTTSTSTTTSDVYAPSTVQNTSSVYSPTSSYSSVNTSSTVGAVTTTTDSHNQQNTYNNPQYGLSALPSGFAGVAGISTAPQTSPITPIPVSASQARPPTIASYPPVNNAFPAPLIGTAVPSSTFAGLPSFASSPAPLVSASNDPGYKGGSGVSAGTLY